MVAAMASILATFLVSIVPIGLLMLMPNFFPTSSKRRTQNEQLVKPSGQTLDLMLCFAAGSLVGDAILHLLLQSMFGDYPSLENSQKQAFAAIIGIATFLAMDIFSRFAQEDDDGSLPFRDELGVSGGQKSVLLLPTENIGASREAARRRKRIVPSPELRMLSTGNISPSPERNCSSHSRGNSGVLSLVADCVHNFTDGLALAAAFSKDLRLGMTTTVAIFLHEVPHEMGDYAILVKAGYQHKRIILLQILTAMAAFGGTFVGIAINSGWIPFLQFINQDLLLPFAAGGFIYVALCSIIPGVLSSSNSQSTFSGCLFKLFAFIMGVTMMSLLE